MQQKHNWDKCGFETDHADSLDQHKATVHKKTTRDQCYKCSQNKLVETNLLSEIGATNLLMCKLSPRVLKMFKYEKEVWEETLARQ